MFLHLPQTQKPNIASSSWHPCFPSFPEAQHKGEGTITIAQNNLNVQGYYSLPNRTYITLIPKMANPTSVNDFWPISLCNVLYKIIVRVLVNRLRPILKSLISVFQNAFVPCRFISDNILLAHEIIEFIWKKCRG